jgi:DNA-directed RNA polymerase subunit RPC12/RpoP
MDEFDIYDSEEEAKRKYWEKRNKGGKKYPCPTCGTPNALTKFEKQAGYQCDACADKEEKGY